MYGNAWKIYRKISHREKSDKVIHCFLSNMLFLERCKLCALTKRKIIYKFENIYFFYLLDVY